MGIDARLYVVTSQKFSDDDVRKLSYEVGLTFGADRFFRSKGWKWDGGEVPPHHNISKVEKIEQDGPDWKPPAGKSLLEVHVFTRFYGVGYERGDLPFLIILAEWLERKIPGCEVMYGGDSSGVCAAGFGAKARAALLDHFAGSHGRDYFKSNWGSGLDPLPPKCDLCEVPMVQFSFGGGQAGFSCAGCGAKLQTFDHGKTFIPYKDRDDG